MLGCSDDDAGAALDSMVGKITSETGGEEDLDRMMTEEFDHDQPPALADDSGDETDEDRERGSNTSNLNPHAPCLYTSWT